MDYSQLMQKAIEVSKNAYSKYSNFSVGACLLSENWNEYCGCNVENSSYGLTICAERNAIAQAVANGECKFKAIAIYSPNAENCLPCGACRQVLHEFGDDIQVITKTGEELKITTIKELLPEGFKL